MGPHGCCRLLKVQITGGFIGSSAFGGESPSPCLHPGTFGLSSASGSLLRVEKVMQESMGENKDDLKKHNNIITLILPFFSLCFLLSCLWGKDATKGEKKHNQRQILTKTNHIGIKVAQTTNTALSISTGLGGAHLNIQYIPGNILQLNP